jgi:hypothetical protein
LFRRRKLRHFHSTLARDEWIFFCFQMLPKGWSLAFNLALAEAHRGGTQRLEL